MSAAKIAVSLRGSPSSAMFPFGAEGPKVSRDGRPIPSGHRGTSSFGNSGAELAGFLLHEKTPLIARHVGLGSKAEVSNGHENVRSWGQSGHRFRAAGGLLLAISGLLGIFQERRLRNVECAKSLLSDGSTIACYCCLKQMGMS